MKLTNKIKTLIVILILTMTIVVSSLESKAYANSPDDVLEVYFTLNGQKNITKQDFVDNIETETWGSVIVLELMLKPVNGQSMPVNAMGFFMDENDVIKSIDLITPVKGKDDRGRDVDIWNVQGSSSYSTPPGLIFNIIRSIPGDFDIPGAGYKLGDVEFLVDPSNIPDDLAITLTYDDFGSDGFNYNADGSNVLLSPFVIGDPNSGPDASLSSLKVEGESTTYLNLTNDIEEDPFIHEVTVSYADSKIENGIAITALPKKAGADVQINEIKSFYTTGDIITIEVTDGPETKTYQIKIIVTDPNDDTSVTFTTNKPSSVKSQGFNGTNSYDITVDFNTLEIQVIPNVHELSTVDVTPLNFTNLQPGETKSLIVWVTSEAGTNNAYTVNVTREQGNSDTSFEVVINSQSVIKEDDTYYKTLAELEDRFSFTISDFVSTTKIYYKLGKHTGVDIADYTILPANRTLSNIQVQKNNNVIYTLLAVAQDGTLELSYIEVERDPSTNVNLSKVTISEIAEGTTHTQDLTRINNTYTYTVKDNDSNIIMFLVSGITGEGQLIEILDENNIPVTEVATSNLNVGDNNYIIRVTAQDGTTSRDYNLVIKKLSDQKEITKIELVNNDDGTTIALGIGGENGFTYDAANNRYSFTLAYGQATNFELILTTSEKSIIFVGQSQSSNNTRVFSGSFNSPTLQNREFTNITIKAENGSVSSAFEIRITRAAADTNNKLEDIQINGVTVDGFLPSKGDYPVTIFERGTSSVFIEGFLPENSKATLQFYVNGSLVSGSRSINLEFTDNSPINVELRVTSESGVVFTYKVPVIAASNDSSIQNIQIYNASTNELVFNSFSQGTLEYNNITLPYSIETIKVVVTTTDAHATVIGIVSNGTYALNTTTPLNLTIFGKSEAGNESTNKYQFTIKRETPRSHKDLETLTVKYIDANNLEVIEELDVDASNNFTLRVDNHITPIQITATILGLQGERIVGSSTNTLTLTENFTAQQKTRTVNIIVVDEGGQQKTYTITITRANNDKVFETVKIGDRTYGIDEFDSNNKLTLDDVLFAVDRLTVLFNMIPNSNSTIVSPTSFIGNNLEGIWYFNSQTGLITANFQVKSEYGELSSVYTIEVYRETALSLKSLNGLKISAGSTVLVDETNTVADSYDIRVDRATSSVVIRTTLPIVDRSSVMSPYQPQVDEAPNKVYTYTLVLNNPNASAATIHQITVQAEDGTTKTYVITIWRRNANINLNEVTIKHGEDILHTGTFETAYEYLGNFEFNVSELTFIIKPADINARITINNGQRLIPVDGVITTTIPLVVGTNREINLKVESDITQDEMSTEYLSKTYKFTYDKKTASNVAELDFLEAIVGGQDLLDGLTLDFANENEFGDFVVNRNFTSVTISATALNGGTITGIGSRVLLVGRNQFIITVTSQSGTHSKDYILVIYRNNDNNYITNIEVANHALGFDPSVTDYDLGTVLYDEDKLDISVTLGDQVHAKYYINNILSQSQVSLNYGLNTNKIQAESDYGTKGTTYTITVFRENPYKDVGLNDLIVYFDDDLNNLITYNANIFTYTLELNPQDTPKTIRVMPELKNSFKQSISSTSNLDDDILINYQDGEINQTIKFIVYAEDNSQQEYTIIIKKGNVKSGDYSINDVIITNTISSNNYILFNPTQYQYSFDVAYSINQLNIDVNLNDLNAVITFVRRPVLLVIGDNLFEFFVTAENGEVGPTYKITVTRNQPSTDNELLELLIADPLNLGAYLLGLDSNNPQVVFDGRQTYTIILNEQYINEIITILFTKKVDAQLVTGDINKQLIIDQKTKRFEINVKPEDPNGITKAYFINVEIKYEQNSLTSLKIDDKNMNIALPLISHTTLKSSVSIQTTLDNIYGNVIIKDSLGNQVSGNTLNLDFGTNDYNIEVYSETGVLVETHILEIIRQKHSDKDITGVTLLGSDGTSYLPNFDESQLVYDIEVPISVNTVTLTANISPTAQLTGGGTYTIDIDQTKVITFFVTAENGDKSDTYTLNVTKRSLSTENEIGEIRFRDPLDNTRFILGLINKDPSYVFSPNIREYTIELGLEYVGKQITVRYEKADPYQTITGLVNGQAIELIRGTNVFKLTVYPEDINNVDPLIYTVTINVRNKENGLESLKIDNQPIAFDSANPINYITENESADVTITPLNTDGKVTIKNLEGQEISSPLNLIVGDNIYTIEVTNEFGQIVESYDLIIERVLSSSVEVFDATLTDNELTNYLLFDKDILYYELFVPFEMNELHLMIDAHLKSRIYIDGMHIVDGKVSYVLTSGETKIISFYVVAENGDIGSTYTLEITKLQNTDDKLKELTILTNLDTLLSINDFDPENNYYAYQVNELHTHVTFSFLVNYGQTITGVTLDEAVLLNHGLNVFEIHVQPEDLTLDPFIITIEIEVINSNIDLSELLVDGQDIYETSKTEYRLDDVSSDTKMINIETILSDINGSVKINGVEADNRTINLVPGENTITIEITSEDLSTTKTYTILINQLLDDSDTLEVLSVLTNLNNYLLGDVTNNPQIIFDPITNTYKFNVNEDVETIFVDFILGSTKQQISGPFNEYLNLEHGENIFEFTVEPEDTTRPHRTYVIEINKVNDEISVDQLLVNGKDIYEEGIFDYTIDSVTNDIKSIKVIPTFDNYATYEIFDANNNLVTGHDVTLSFGINNIRVVATSESGLYTQTYTITIEQTYSDDNEIIDVRFFDASTNINRLNFDPDITTYNIEFPTTTNIARLRVETHNKALVFINDEQEINTRKDFNLISGNTITVKFYVVAENGDKGIEYTINVYKRKASDPVLSDNTNLLDVTIEIPINELKFNFDPTLYEYNIQLPYGHDEMYIKGHTESKGATVFGEGAYDLLPGVTKVIRLRVTAEDGTVAEKEYKFNITRALPNTDTTLKTLTIEDLNGNVLAFDQTTFNPENRTYNITLDDSMKLNTVNVLAEKNHETQTLYNTGIIQLHGEVEGYYNTIITVTVVAEDGSVGEYIIYVLHDLDFASLAEVKDISILGDDGISYFGLEFKNNIYVYEDILVPFNVDTTRLIVQTIGNVIYLDANNTEIDDNRLQSFGVGSQIVYRFRIESTNGSNKSEVYTIYVNRQQIG